MAAETGGESTVLNVRISRSRLETFKKLAQRYDVSIASVVNAFLMWAEVKPGDQQTWVKGVALLQKEMSPDNPIVIDEITVDDYEERMSLCQRLRSIGYIEAFSAKQSKRDQSLIICSYSLTQAGRIIAAILQDAVEVPDDSAPENQPSKSRKSVAPKKVPKVA